MVELFDRGIFLARSPLQVVSELGFEVKLTKDGGGPEKWDDPKM